MRANLRLVEFSEYISPDGERYYFDARRVKGAMSFLGDGMPPIEYISQRGPFQHGETIYDYRLNPRVIQFVHYSRGKDRHRYWDKRSEIMNLLRPNRQTAGNFSLGTLRKYMIDGTLRDIDVMIEQGPLFESMNSGRWDEFGFLETLRFIAPDPTFYDPSQGTLTWALGIAQTDIEFPIEFPIDFSESLISGETNTITYLGTWLSYPEIVITGPISGFNIENTDTGKYIQLNYLIQAGETVTISLAYGNKTVSSDVRGNIIGAVTTDSDLSEFAIVPDPEASGGVNTFEVNGASADNNTQVVLNYYTRYIGI